MRTVWVVLALAWASPALAVDPTDVGISAETRFSSGRPEPVPADPWWRAVDADLGATIDEALAGNPDLRRSRAAAEQALGVANQARAAISPTLTGNARTSVAPTESLGFQFGGLPTVPGQPEPPKTYSQGSATLDAAWSVDVFGRSTASWRAAGRDASASASDLDDLGESVAAQVGGAWLDVAAARERVAVVEGQIRTNRELLEVLDLRYARGDASSLDVLQQRQTLASTNAQLPAVKLALASAEQRLAVLCGKTPTTRVPVDDTLPDLPEAPAVGRPVDLVDNRPDLRAVALRVAAARDRRWSSYAALAPTFGLSAQAGWQYFDNGEAIEQTYWNAGASVSVPLFGGGRTWGGVQQARAAVDLQEAAFHAGLLNAVLQVETALQREVAQRDTMTALIEQEQAARLAFEAARDQYLKGVTPFLNVQTAVSRHQASELAVVQGRRDLWSARIALHEALGGPWTRELASETR